MNQDKIAIHGPETDGTYIVEFKTADGVALAFSVPKGGGTAVLEYFQDKMPYGLAVPDAPLTISTAYWPKARSKRPDPPLLMDGPGLAITHPSEAGHDRHDS